MGWRLGRGMYWPITVGVVLIILALSLSIVGLHKQYVHYTESGVLSPGVHVLGNNTFETNGYVLYNRSLTMASQNATVVVSWEGTSHKYSVNLTRNITIRPGGRPILNVSSGEVTYTYSATATTYPYDFLAVPAFISMVVGTVFVFVGYIVMKRGAK